MALFGLGGALSIRTIVTLANKQFIGALNQMDAKTEASVAKFRRASMGFAAGGAAIALVLGKSVKEAAKFEQQMANMNSVARVSQSEFKKLEGLAKKMGRTTRVSATDSAKAMYELASAGQRTAQIIQTLPGIIDLSTATQYNMSETTQTVVAALNQFGLETNETDRVVNVFAATIGNTLGKMEKLQNSFKMVGTSGKDAGLEIEELAAALGIMYNAGMDGSSAGTALRRVLASLLNPSESLKARIHELGMTIDDIDPRMNSLGDIMEKLKRSGMDARAAFQDFGLRGAGALLALLNAGEGLDELEKKITGTRDAATMAATQLNSLEGSMDQLRNTSQVLFIEWGTSLIPMVQRLTDGMQGLTESMTDADEEMVAMGTRGALTVGGWSIGMMALGQMATMMGAAVTGALAVISSGLVALGIGWDFFFTKAGLRWQEHIDALTTGNEKAAKEAKKATEFWLRMADALGFVVPAGTIASWMTLTERTKDAEAAMLSYVRSQATVLPFSPLLPNIDENGRYQFPGGQTAVTIPYRLVPEGGRGGGGGGGGGIPGLPRLGAPPMEQPGLGEGARGGIPVFVPREEDFAGWLKWTEFRAEQNAMLLEGETGNIDGMIAEWDRMQAAFQRVGQQMMAVSNHMAAVLQQQLADGKSFMQALGTAVLQGLVKILQTIVRSAIQEIVINRVKQLGLLTMSGFFDMSNWAKIGPMLVAAAAATATLNGLATIKFHEGGAPFGLNEEMPIIVRPRREGVVDLKKAQLGGYGSSMLAGAGGGIGNVDISITIQRAEVTGNDDWDELGTELGLAFLDAVGRG